MKRILALVLALMLAICLAATAAADGEPAELSGDGVQYRLVEEQILTEIDVDQVPLAAAPQSCCIMHFVLMVGALAVAVYFTHDRKTHQWRIYELRRAGMN